MSDTIVGICRFSFVGRGDWTRFAAVRREGGEVQSGLLEAQAAELFAPARLERRFRAFEALCLPSIAAQRDRDFRFVILTSPRMPAPWLARLRAAAEAVPMAEVLVSDAPDVASAMSERLARIAAAASGGLVQFRLDDDDALAQDFIGNLRGHVARLSDLEGYAVSFMRNLAVTLYPGAPAGFWRFDEPFYSAGLAIKPRQAAGSVFDFGHFGVQKRLTHILDTTEMGGLVLKWPSDSKPVTLDGGDDRFSPLDGDEFRTLLHQHFPFAVDLDFDHLRAEVENA